MLIFLGITLAVWFNNWNTASRIKTDKENAIMRIKEEIQHNAEQLVSAQQDNQPLRLALQDYFGASEAPVLLPSRMEELQRKHPGFAQVNDSTVAEDGRYHYDIHAQINIQFPELTQIAWETTQTIGVAKEFDYDCLYEIEKAYNLQRSFLREMEKVAEAMQQQDVQRMATTLSFSNDYGATLENYYQNVLNQIDNCR